MKWEYQTVKVGSDNFSDENLESDRINDFIDEFGNEDWELVSAVGVVSYSSGEQPWTKEILLFFKRPRVQ